MTPEQAHKIMARWAIWKAFEVWIKKDDLWESEFPDFSVGDMLGIEEAATSLLPPFIQFAEYRIAHKVLADRAKGAAE